MDLVKLLVACRLYLAVLQGRLGALFLHLFAPVRVLGYDLRLEAAAFDLEVLPEHFRLHHQSIFVLNLLDATRVDTAGRIQALTDRVPVLLELF